MNAVVQVSVPQADLTKLKNLRTEVNRSSDVVSAAGFGLSAIADLLGADASEHYISANQRHGLANAVLAIGELLKETGGRLWEISEPEESSNQAEATE